MEEPKENLRLYLLGAGTGDTILGDDVEELFIKGEDGTFIACITNENALLSGNLELEILRKDKKEQKEPCESQVEEYSELFGDVLESEDVTYLDEEDRQKIGKFIDDLIKAKDEEVGE